MDPGRRNYTRVITDPISPTAEFGHNVKLGLNVIIGDGCKIGDNVLIDHNTILRPNVIIADNTEIRPFCFIAEGADIGSGVKIFHYTNICKDAIIGDRVYIGVGVKLTNTMRISHGRGYIPKIEPPIIEDFVRIGTGAIVMPGIRIGKNALVGAGAVVTRHVQEGEVVKGIPAHRTGEVPIEERI